MQRAGWPGPSTTAAQGAMAALCRAGCVCVGGAMRSPTAAPAAVPLHGSPGDAGLAAAGGCTRGGRSCAWRRPWARHRGWCHWRAGLRAAAGWTAVLARPGSIAALRSAVPGPGPRHPPAGFPMRCCTAMPTHLSTSLPGCWRVAAVAGGLDARAPAGEPGLQMVHTLRSQQTPGVTVACCDLFRGFKHRSSRLQARNATARCFAKNETVAPRSWACGGRCERGS